jgi:hypothetical protein
MAATSTINSASVRMGVISGKGVFLFVGRRVVGVQGLRLSLVQALAVLVGLSVVELEVLGQP